MLREPLALLYRTIKPAARLTSIIYQPSYILHPTSSIEVFPHPFAARRFAALATALGYAAYSSVASLKKGHKKEHYMHIPQPKSGVYPISSDSIIYLLQPYYFFQISLPELLHQSPFPLYNLI